MLEKIGFTVRHVTTIKHQQSNITLPLIFIDLARETISKKIFNITYVVTTKIKVEEPYKHYKILEC